MLNILFPRRCLGCGLGGGYFCSECLNKVVLRKDRICPVCQKGSFGGLPHLDCSPKTSLDGLTNLFAYQGIMEKAIKKLKYRFVTDIAREIVELVLTIVGEDQLFSSFCQSKKPIFIPIPLHRTKERWRGFNQTELLGKLIASQLGLSFVPDNLIRIKKTIPQFTLDQGKRKENIDSAFKASKQKIIKDKDLLLFDDVWGSGATLTEAAKTLKNAGAKSVWGLTLAR